MKHKVPKRVEVVWIDAVSEDEKKPKDDDALCWELGYLVEKTRKFITLAREWSPETNEFRWFIRIPMKIVEEVRTIGQEFSNAASIRSSSSNSKDIPK